MSIFSLVESGTSFHKSRFTKSISNIMTYDCQFHQMVPVLKRFVLPGDVWKISGDVLVRFQPMRTPTLTTNNFRVRYFFVPLRLVEKDTELIITGSKDGHLYTGALPVFDNFVKYANKNIDPDAFKVLKHSFWDYMNVQCLDYENIKNDECLPANYWLKGYERIKWDFYDDENLSYGHRVFGDFETYMQSEEAHGCNFPLGYSLIKKDYFSSSLPWQLKGVAPRIDVTGTASFSPSYNENWFNGVNDNVNSGLAYVQGLPISDGNAQFFLNGDNANSTGVTPSSLNNMINGKLNATQSINLNGLGFTADDLRTMMAQTRIFERLARTGSRYVEYLKANFGLSPTDETLQRPQYLGGWKVPIVTTEVLQTAQGTDPVGTMRGHGITRGGNSINTFIAKEFGMLFGIAEVRPNIEYSTGINRQLTYKRRFDFFNPSLQHLSEQEVRNGELFISNSDGLNDDTFGFQAYGNELRTYQNEAVGDMRDTLADWNQALAFTSRPNLNGAFIGGNSHLASFNRPFVVQGATSYPIIVQFANHLDVYRPMVRYATPGLVDHL